MLTAVTAGASARSLCVQEAGDRRTQDDRYRRSRRRVVLRARTVAVLYRQRIDRSSAEAAVAASTTVPDGGAPGPQPSARRTRGAIAVLAGVAQVGVLAFNFLMGLGGGGLTYLAALLQAAAALAVIARLAERKAGRCCSSRWSRPS